MKDKHKTNTSAKRIRITGRISQLEKEKLSVTELKELFKTENETELKELIDRFSQDERAGIRKLAESGQKKLDGIQKEKERIEGLKKYEKEYGAYSYICGIDEVGRGPLAGPVVAGAVILPKDCDILYINDSKKLSEKKREELYDIIMKKAVACGIGYATPERIDEINI